MARPEPPKITLETQDQHVISLSDDDEHPTSPTLRSPPSPTLSAGSVRFNNATALRENHPTSQSGNGSLALLGPHSHHRKPSLSTNPDSPEIPLTPLTAVTTKEGDANFEPVDPLPRRDTEEETIVDDGVDPTPWSFHPTRLAALVANNAKDLDLLERFGGADGLVRGLGTDRDTGLSAAALAVDTGDGPPRPDKDRAFTAPLEERKRVYGVNVLPTRRSKSLLLLMWLALKDKVLVLLCIAAAVSLALGLYSDFGVKQPLVACPSTGLIECTEPKVDWVEGVAILAAVLIVVLVGSVNDWQKERQFRTLNEQKEDRTVKVIRNGQEAVINIKDIVVGDIALVEPGEIIPVDGVFLKGHHVVCDESGATGESKTIHKFSYEDAIRRKNGATGSKGDCFLVSGSKVLEGVGEYVVIAVGPRSFNGKILMDLNQDDENTPLQIKLNALAELIAKLGSLAGLILFTALMIRFFIHLKTDPGRSGNAKAMEFTQILIIAVTVIVVAVPEGLPLAVTLALAFATKRMTKERLLVRVLGSCEIMANASVICTDKTGTLTTNVMTVVAGSIGIHAKFSRPQDNRPTFGTDASSKRKNPDDFSIDLNDVDSVMTTSLRDAFNDAIAINSTAFEDKDKETGAIEFIGSKTETALLQFAKDHKWAPYHERRASAKTVHAIPFSSERKSMGVVVQLDGKYRAYFKGASEILVKECNRHVVVHHPDSKPSAENTEIPVKDFDETDRDNISRTIICYANESLRTIAICYRDLPQWPPKGVEIAEDGDVPFEALLQDLTLISVVAIEDPLRPGVKQAVEDCKNAGVMVKMCTGDNILTARSIAHQCGIFTPGGIIMDGPTFRNLTEKERTDIVPRLQVLARSSPSDKKILVEKLKALGEIVGVTGDGTNDAPALKNANVGFSMGIAGTEVAKEASDIILMDDNFASIVSAIMWGRCVNDAVRKFLQFQVSVNITAVVITFVSAVASSEEESVLTAVQLLWINIIMDTFAALALATDPASRELLDRKPDRKTAPLFNTAMRMQILFHALYQTFIILLFHFGGDIIFGYQKDQHTDVEVQQWHAELNTLVFNAFVFCQIFNSVNCRRIDSRKNVFQGISKNWYFIVITFIEIAAQILIIFIGGAAFSVHRLTGKNWGISIALGFGSLPLGFLVRCIPESKFEWFFRKLHLSNQGSVLVTTNPQSDERQWNLDAINTVRDNLQTFANIRGGRVRSSSFVRKSRTARMQEAGVQFPSLLAMVPTLVMTSIGAGWHPQAGDLADAGGFDPSTSAAALASGKLQMHPDTPEDDLYYKKYVSASLHP